MQDSEISNTKFLVIFLVLIHIVLNFLGLAQPIFKTAVSKSFNIFDVPVFIINILFFSTGSIYLDIFLNAFRVFVIIEIAFLIKNFVNPLH